MSIILAEVNAGSNERLDAIIRTLELTCHEMSLMEFVSRYLSCTYQVGELVELDGWFTAMRP